MKANEKEKEISTEEVEKVEEDKVETQKVEEPEIKTPETFEYPTEALKGVESARAVFLKKYKLQNVFKWLISLFSLLVIVVAWIALPNIKDSEGQQAKWVLPVIIAVVVVMILVIFLYSLIIKVWLKKQMKSYFDIYYHASNDYVFSQNEGVIVKSMQIDGRILPVEFVDNKLFVDIAEVSSRNVVEYTYNDVEINSCDCAAQVRLANKQLSIVFVGKYLRANINYNSDDEIIIYLKGDKRGIVPTNLLHLRCVLDNPKMMIYTNNSNYNKVINAKVKKVLSKLVTDKDLIDVTISLQNGKMFVLMGYDDSLMIIPLQNAFDSNPTKSLKEDINIANELIALFAKKSDKKADKEVKAEEEK